MRPPHPFRISPKILHMISVDNYAKVDLEIVQQLKAIVGEQFVFVDEESLNHYAHDETENLHFPPEVVVKPRTTEEISQIMKLCNDALIPVTPRGAGTGLAGAALADKGGVLLSTERLNSILKIDERNHQVITEPGVITEVLMEEVKKVGLFYPPDPSSRGSCFIGGNISANSGGPKAVKYGVVRDYVLNLEVVLPNGEIIWTRRNIVDGSSNCSTSCNWHTCVCKTIRTRTCKVYTHTSYSSSTNICTRKYSCWSRLCN